MMCRNGLHEIDPNDDFSWRPRGRRYLCKECYLECHRRNNKTEKGRAAHAKYRRSEKGRAVMRRRSKLQVLNGKAAEHQERYRQSDKGMIAAAREEQRRRAGGPGYTRRRAQRIAREQHGIALWQIERDGLLDAYPDIKAALEGSAT